MKFIISIVLFAGVAVAHPPAGNRAAPARGPAGNSVRMAFNEAKKALDGETNVMDQMDTVIGRQGLAGLTGNLDPLVTAIAGEGVALNNLTAVLGSGADPTASVEAFARAEVEVVQAAASLINNPSPTLNGTLSSVTAGINNVTLAVSSLEETLKNISSSSAEALGASVAQSGLVPSLRNLGPTRIILARTIRDSIAEGKSSDPTGDLAAFAKAEALLGTVDKYLSDDFEDLNYQ